MAETNYDLIIIGGGPAGLTAGMYASRARLNTVLVGQQYAEGGQILITDWIENYPGFPEGISGPDLSKRMLEQAQQFDLNFEYGEVEKVALEGEVKSITIGDKVLTAKTVIIASGAAPRSLHVGEERFLGKGVSYCATCDAPFYKDKVVVAVGGGDTAVQESLYLTKFAKKVYLVHRRDQLRAAKILQERVLANDKIEMVWDSVVTGMDGLFGIENVSIKNVKTDEETKIVAHGCFIWVGILPNTDFLGEALEMDEWKFIKTDANMATNIPGVFAAGDVRSTTLRQVATAVGDAAIAATLAEHYIEGH